MKTLILIRHAHRDKPPLGANQNNGLSAKGKSQAEAIKRLFLKLYPDTAPLLVSSPKERCIETLMPLGEKLDLDIEVMKELGEGDGLASRIDAFYRWWQNEAPALTVACSHGDWIPDFVYKVNGARIDCSKGSWCELGESTVSPKIITLIQKAKDFVD